MKRHFTIIFICLLPLTLSGQDLNSFLLEAAQNNPELKAQYFRYNAALEQVDQQNALPDPTLSFGYFISPVETRVGPQRFKLSIAQMFPWVGTLKVKEAVAASAAKVAYEKFEELKNSLFQQVKLAYLDLYILNQELLLKEEDIEVLKSYEPISKTKYESNLVSLSDLIRVQIAIENAEAQLEVMEAKKASFLSQFNTLLNRPVDAEAIISGLPDLNSEQDQTLDSALAKHPSIIRAKSQLAASEKQIELSNRSTKPSIGIGLDYAFVDQRTDMNVSDNGKDILMPMLSFSLPIFGKRNKAIQKEAQFIRSSSISQLELTENQIKNAWSELNYLESKAQTELEQLTREIKQTELLLSVLLSEYSNNNSNFEELLATQQKFLQLQLALIAVEKARYKATFLQEYLTGKTLNEIKAYDTE